MDQFKMLANYNQWMNSSLYQSCQSLTPEQLAEDRGAFFGSILATLNHLLIGDGFWLSRCSGNETYMLFKDELGELIQLKGLGTILYENFSVLSEKRQQMDLDILQYVDLLTEDDLSCSIGYQTSKGDALHNRLDVILIHWFNHQTHHRGQITTLLSQLGVDYGVTDLIYIKDEFM
ncbi:MAG: DinB family protein [Pseudomonadales bacterium]|nr:DinB family protein [Pseudomonadales bacterium]